MVALFFLFLTLAAGFVFPGVLVSGFFFGFVVEIVSGSSVTTTFSLLAVLVLLAKRLVLRRRIVLNHIDALFVLLVLWELAAVMWAPNSRIGVSKGIGFVLPALSLYAAARLASDIGDWSARLREFFAGLCFLALFLGPFVLAQGTMIGGRIRFEDLGNVSVGISKSFVLASIAGLYFMFLGRSRHILVRGLGACAFCLSIYVINASGTRGALLALSFGVFALYFLSGAFGNFRKHFAVYGPVAALVGVVLSFQFDWGAMLSGRLFRFDAYLGQFDASSIIRMGQYSDAMALFNDAPLFGQGLGGYQAFSGLPYPHNVFLEVAADTGIVGVVLLVAFLMAICFVSFGLRPSSRPELACYLAMFFGSFLQHQVSFSISAWKELFIVGFVGALYSLQKGRARSFINKPVPSVASSVSGSCGASDT